MGYMPQIETMPLGLARYDVISCSLCRHPHVILHSFSK